MDRTESLDPIFIPSATEGNEDVVLVQPPPPPPLKELGVFNLIKPEGHNFPIREKHVPKLKRDLKASLRKNLATYWLTLDTRHSQVCNRFSFPNGQPQSKNLKQQKPFPLSRCNILSYN